MTLTVKSASREDTIKLAHQIGQRLKGGEIIDLIGDLGSGKTTFVKGLAAGIGYKGDVTSPTFTLQNKYIGQKLTIDHFDFYRLSQPGLLRDQLAESLADGKSVVVIEWSQVVDDVLSKNRVSLEMMIDSETGRQLKIDYPINLKYLFG